MTSGISVSKAAIEMFQFIKSSKKMRYAIFNVSPCEAEIIPGDSVPKPDKLDLSLDAVKKEWTEFCTQLPLDGSCYAVYDMSFQKHEGSRRDKLILVTWCPEGCTIRQKMMCAATSKALKSAFNGIQVDVQACDMDDLEFEGVQQKVEKS